MAPTSGACISVDKPFHLHSSFKFPMQKYGETQRDHFRQHLLPSLRNLIFVIMIYVVYCAIYFTNHVRGHAVAEKI